MIPDQVLLDLRLVLPTGFSLLRVSIQIHPPESGILGLPMQMGVFLNGGIMEILVRLFVAASRHRGVARVGWVTHPSRASYPLSRLKVSLRLAGDFKRASQKLQVRLF